MTRDHWGPATPYAEWWPTVAPLVADKDRWPDAALCVLLRYGCYHIDYPKALRLVRVKAAIEEGRQWTENAE